MRRELWTSLLWQFVGLLLYLAGMVLFLVVVVDVYLLPPADSIENFTATHAGLVFGSLVLIVAGRVIDWKLGTGLSVSNVYRGATTRSGPEQSRLEQLGYQLPPEETTSDVAYVDGKTYVVCRQCGTRNEPGYSYCSDCSSELPE